jgi:hypothetical protein
MDSQCDPDGNQYVLLNAIVDFRKTNTALSIEDQKIVVKGRASLRCSTIGWQLCCEWKDKSTSWEKLSELKESHPLETAEYCVAQNLTHEPAFNWWVPHVLKKRDRIISLVKQRKARYLKKTHKFGIEVPTSVAHAFELDKRNGNTLWADGITKEMTNVKVAFNVLEEGQRAPIGYQFMKCHMIFDVKMEDFRRKARLVARGHMTSEPDVITYSSVVSRETVRLTLTIAALNDLEVKSADIMNAYITAPTKEKIWTTLGPEFGNDEGKKAIIVRALYGLKSSGAAFRNHLAECMYNLGYKSCLADPDLWYKPEAKPDGTEYYSYILCYVDDILVIHHDTMPILTDLDKHFKLKPGSVGDPDIYLGTKLKQTKLPNGVWAWGMSPSKYVNESVKNCANHLKTKLNGKYSLPKKAENPFKMGCDPPLDVSAALNPSEATYYQSLIGTLRWMVEIGRIDIATEVSILSSHLAYPREGRMEAALHIMAYLKQKHNSHLVFDPTYPSIDMSTFKKNKEWHDFYRDAKEAIPPNAPEPRGKDVDLRMMVDSDHAGDKVTRRSRTGFMIFVNMALIQWMSKKQATIESFVFGAEFVAMKQGVETLRGLRYKLRMMGVPCEHPSYIYGDNMSVIHNTQRPESTLKKKSNSICYHLIRESVAMGESLTSHISTHDNYSDILTKVTYGQKRRNLVGGVLYDIYDDV